MTRKQAGEYRAIIEQGAQLLEDGEALKVKTLYPEWEPGKDYPVGCKATYDDSKYDPIPYGGNMALTAGLYYIQSGVTYKCTRDTGNPVYAALAGLVGIYVEVIDDL